MFGVLRPSRSKYVGVGSGFFVSFMVFYDVLGLNGSTINDYQMEFTPVCFGISFSISS